MNRPVFGSLGGMCFVVGFVVILILGFVVGFTVILIVGFMVDFSVVGFWTGFSIGFFFLLALIAI